MTHPRPSVARRSICILGVLAAAVFAIPAFATEIYIAMEGVAGESVTTGFVGQIAAQSVSLGYSSPTDKSPVLAPVVISKQVDKATPVLMQAGAKGQVFKSVVISSVRNFPSGKVVFQTIKLTDARITDWRLVDPEGDRMPVEEVTFAPASITVTYTPVTPQGGKGPPVVGVVSEK